MVQVNVAFCDTGTLKQTKKKAVKHYSSRQSLACWVSHIFAPLKMEPHHLASNPKQQDLYLEANSSWDRQEIPSFLWTPKLQRRSHNSPPLAHIIAQMNPLFKVHFNIILSSSAGSSKWSLSFRFPHLIPVLISLLPCVLHVPPVSYSLIRWPEKPVRSKKHEASHNATLSSPLLLRPS